MRKSGADYSATDYRGVGSQGTSGCSLTNAVPGNGKGGSTRKGVVETQCSVGGTPGDFEIFA